MSPLSYFGRRRCGKNARYLYALVFDLDGVGMPQLRDTLHQMNKDILPQATFVVNSGTGLHLYYVLKEPVPMYPYNQKCLKELKYSLTRQIWNKFTSTIKEPQMQGILQGFRVVGSGSKLGREYPVRAFRLGGPVELARLLDYIPDSNGEQQRLEGLMRKSRLSLAEAKEKYPDWYERRIVKKERRGRWTVKRDLYDWWLHRIADEIRVGHRFYGIMTLAIYAKKCGIDEDELRRDAFALLRPYDDMSVEDINRFTKDDVVCALEMFNEDYVTFPRDDIAKLSGLTMPVNKRNWRKQAEHIQVMNTMKALKKQQIAVILVLSVILSTFAAVTPVSAATLSAQQYLEKMGIAVRNLKSYDFTQTTDQKMTMEGQIIQNKTVVKQSVYNSPLKVKSVTDTTTVLAGMSSKNQAVAYLTKDADGLLWEYISSNGSGYQKTGILNYTNQIKGMDISMYSDAKIVKKKIKVNRINTVQISAQVKGSDVVKFLDQMGMSKEINAAAAVDYNTLPAIKVTCWIDKKTCRPVRTTADMKAFMNGYMSALYQKLGQDLKLVYSQAKTTVTYKNFNKAATFTIPKECR